MTGSEAPIVRAPRSLPATRAFEWYAEALRLFKRQPLRFAALALALIVIEVAFGLIPVVGRPIANAVVPLLACGLLYASLATDRGDRPNMRQLIAPFAAPPRSIAAILVSGLLVFLVQWMIAWQLAGVNILASADEPRLDPLTVFVSYGAGIAASLPLTFVPFAALFDEAPFGAAFRSSASAFARNVPAFLLYGAMSIALLGVALVTMGIGLLVVLPLWAASSYVAWKEIYA
ncbi:MAG TPA: BPSS1780 family membrane protein [Casimicrobiaceae bacterium]|nr:BPSS1780 family membrane protein [Casimicrobiaceae bacterium]